MNIFSEILHDIDSNPEKARKWIKSAKQALNLLGFTRLAESFEDFSKDLDKKNIEGFLNLKEKIFSIQKESLWFFKMKIRRLVEQNEGLDVWIAFQETQNFIERWKKLNLILSPGIEKNIYLTPFGHTIQTNKGTVHFEDPREIIFGYVFEEKWIPFEWVHSIDRDKNLCFGNKVLSLKENSKLFEKKFAYLKFSKNSHQYQCLKNEKTGQELTLAVPFEFELLEEPKIAA